MITERLKAETKANHDETERFSYAHKIMDGSLNIHEYKQLIIKNYVFHKIVEGAFAAFDPITQIGELDMTSRMKTAALEADLTELGLSSAHLPSVTTLRFNSLEEAFGYLYVVEGATLGGSYILKALQRNPQILAEVTNFHYYGVYGETIGQQWKNFQAALTQYIASPEQEDQTIDAAKKGFDLFRHIFTTEMQAV